MKTQKKLRRRPTKRKGPTLRAWSPLERGVAWILLFLTIVNLSVSEVWAASTWNPTAIVNTEAFQTIDDADSSANIVLKFGGTLGEKIAYDRSAARFVFSRGLTVGGGITATGNLIVRAHMSGSSLQVDRNATIGATLTTSGALTGMGNITAKGILSGRTLQIGNGNAQINGTLTASGMIRTESTFSGQTLHISGNSEIRGYLAATGAIRTEGDLNLNDDNGAVDAVLTFGNATAAQTMKYLNTAQKFQFSKGISVIGTLSGSNLNVDRNATVGGKLAVSGATVFVGAVSVTGSVMLEGNLTGATLNGFGLPSAGCTGSNKLLWDSATGKFSCTADLTGGAGLVDHYVRASGDTMTGGLLIQNGNPAGSIDAGLMLEVSGAMSGRTLQVTGTGARFTNTTATGAVQPLLATDVSLGAIVVGSGGLRRSGTGVMLPQLAVTGRLPVTKIGSSATGLSNPQAVAVQGRYAYVANGTSLVVYDVSNPGSPVSIGSSAAGLSSPQAIAVQGRYAYIVSSSSNTLVIFDISNPVSPSMVGSTSAGISNPQSVAVQGRYAYVASLQNSTLLIFDVSNPSAPVKVGSSMTGLSGPQSVTVQGRYAYVADQGNESLVIFDVSNPSLPIQVGASTSGLSDPFWVAVQGRYAYVVSNGNSTFAIFDVSNPASPVNVGSSTSGLASPNSIAIQGRYAYVTDQTNNTLLVFDVSNPRSPAMIGSANSGLSVPLSIAVQGRYAYIINFSNSSLVLFDLGGAYIQQLEAGGAEVGELAVRTNASVFNNLDVGGGATFGRGIHATGPSSIVGSATGSYALTIKAATGALGLRVQGLMSGQTLHVTGGATVRGVLTATGNVITDGDLTINDDLTAATDAVLTFGNATASQTIKFVHTMQRFQFSKGISVLGTMSGSSLNVDRNATIGGKFTASGAGFLAAAVSISGALMLEGNLTGATINGFGLRSSGCSNATADKLLWDAATGKFSCGSDQTGGGAAGLVDHYVRASGDTMTGGLLIESRATGTSPGALDAGLLLEVSGAMSGRSLQVTGTGAKPILYTDVMRGAVGIGTSTPTAQLTISGGTLLQLAGGTSKTLSGVDLGANVNAVYVSGNFAYVATDANASAAEFRTIDITNPNAPSIAGSYEISQNVTSTFISTRHAFVGLSGANGGSGLLILDNSNPGAQVLVGRINFGSDVNSIYVSGKYAFVGLDDYAANTGTLCAAKSLIYSGCNFRIIDFTNVNAPTVIGGLKVSANLNAVYVQNRYAYLGFSTVASNDFRIVDLVNPVDPTAVGGIDYSNTVQSLYVSGKYAFIGLATDAGAEFRVVDTSNKASPVAAGSLEIGTTVESIGVLGDWARLGLTSAAGDDYWTIDMRSPASPKKVGGVDLSSDVNSLFLAGKYAYVGLNSIAGNDMHIVDLDGIESPAASIGTLATSNLTVSDNARFDNNAYIRNALNVGRGGIISKGPVSVQSTGTGVVRANTGAVSYGYGGRVGTGNNLSAFEVRNGTGKLLFNVIDDGRVQAGIPSSATGSMQIMLHPVWGRKTGWAHILLPASDTALTAVGMSTLTVVAAGTNAIGLNNSRPWIRYTVAANTSGTAAGNIGPYTQTRQGYRPRYSSMIQTGTGVTSQRFWGGLAESSVIGLAPTLVTAATAIDYVGMAWDSAVNGGKWMCCSGDGANHNCIDMGAPAVTANTEYLIDVDYSQPGRLTCRLQVGSRTFVSFKDAKLTRANVNLGPQTSLTTTVTGGTNICRTFYINRVSLEQN